MDSHRNHGTYTVGRQGGSGATWVLYASHIILANVTFHGRRTWMNEGIGAADATISVSSGVTAE